ncbi:unnamed protein product [Symbiodinium natans]|uniref:Uncharacterized protein n=1 Tax=Symbiodinium natans TaxID=878477 RepID=A0A812QZF6_9DINO|nr:unnamed protein product [Symbiodinium natans]
MQHLWDPPWAQEVGFKALKPVKRPAEWGAELPEDPILCSQASPAMLTGLRAKLPEGTRTKAWKVAAGYRNKGGTKRPRMAPTCSLNAHPADCTESAMKSTVRARGGFEVGQPPASTGAEAIEHPAECSKQRQYNILDALGIPNAREKPAVAEGEQMQLDPPKSKKKRQVQSTGQRLARDQLLRQFALNARSSKSKDTVEGTVEERTDEEETATRRVKAFQVQLKTTSGNVKRVIFNGAAARAFHRSLGLQRGGRVRLQGFTSTRENDEEVLRFKDVHSGVSIKVVATAAMSLEAEAVLRLQDLKAHLAKVKRGEAKAVVSVQAVAGRVGKLERQELALQPGEFAATRTIQLQCPSSNLAYVWRLWDAQAEKFGADLQGQQLVINGTRVREARGEAELTGCVSVDVKGGRMPPPLSAGSGVLE